MPTKAKKTSKKVAKKTTKKTTAAKKPFKVKRAEEKSDKTNAPSPTTIVEVKDGIVIINPIIDPNP